MENALPRPGWNGEKELGNQGHGLLKLWYLWCQRRQCEPTMVMGGFGRWFQSWAKTELQCAKIGLVLVRGYQHWYVRVHYGLYIGYLFFLLCLYWNNCTAWFEYVTCSKPTVCPVLKYYALVVAFHFALHEIDTLRTWGQLLWINIMLWKLEVRASGSQQIWKWNMNLLGQYWGFFQVFHGIVRDLIGMKVIWINELHGQPNHSSETFSESLIQ